MSVTGSIKERIRARLQAADVGVVYAYERYANADDKLREYYKDADGMLRGWTIARESSPGERRAPAESDRTPVYVIRGFRAVSDADASASSFDDDVETVQDTLGEDVTCGGLAEHVEEPQLRVIEHRMFGGVLCHYAEIAIRVHVGTSYTLV